MTRGNGLFANGDTHATFEKHKKEAVSAVELIPSNHFMNSSDDQLVEHVCAKMHIEPLALFEDRATMDHSETKIDVSRDFRYGAGWGDEKVMANATQVTISIPYTGDPMLWQLKPSHSYMRSFPGEVTGLDHQGVGTLRFRFTRHADADANEFKRAYEEELKYTKEMIGNVNADLQRHMAALSGAVRQEVQRRRHRLGNQATIASVLNIPMTRRAGAPDTAPIAAPRKLVKPLPPAPSAKPEPTLQTEVYEHILSVIRHEGRSFETTPKTFAKHGEEELRDFVLAHLNGHYQGAAAGERFRNNGKTDICIEDELRAAFVAECKVWRGAKEVGEAVDQLLSYLTWRDCKCCLVFFNTKVAGFTGVQTALADALREHGAFVADAGTKENGEWRFRFRQPGDEQRIVTVHIFCFDLYVKPVDRKRKATS